MSKPAQYVIGVDYGTDSVRAILVDTQTGETISAAVKPYSRWQRGQYCNPLTNQFRQHPLDYLEGLEGAIREMVRTVSAAIRSNVVGLSIATTGSTPVAVNRDGTPLALLPQFADNPNAMFILWKDHTAIAEAEEINALAHLWPVDYTRYVGGSYSSEWFWAKLLHILRVDADVAQQTYSWVEHCDWLPACLTGQTDPVQIKRSRCAAGHKAMWHPTYNGLPEQAFWSTLDTRLDGIRQQLHSETYTADQPVGTLSDAWAERLNLPRTTLVSVGAIDAHVGAVGALIEPFALVKVTGTSTCDMLIAPTELIADRQIRGICGQVDGSILPAMVGMEAGQSAFGDLYAWFRELLAWPVRELLASVLSPADIEACEQAILPMLAEKASALPVTENDPVALDWINGRRTPDANQSLTGVLTGLRLGDDSPRVFKSLVEATAFGSRAILERFIDEGIPVNQVIAVGGIAQKSPYVMQTLADVLQRPVRVVTAEQPVALGAAMLAATAAGVYPSIEQAQQVMGRSSDRTYQPDTTRQAVYDKLYARYKTVGRLFDTPDAKPLIHSHEDVTHT